MLRAIAAVVAGYVTLAVVLFALAFAGVGIVGVEPVYNPGTYVVSNFWGVCMLLMALASSILGGWVCALIARSPAPTRAFAAVVIVLGVVVGVGERFAPPPGPRPVGEPIMRGASKASHPGWLLIVRPLVGAAGVVIGAGFRGARRA